MKDKKYIVKTSDLKGEIADFPRVVVQKMLEETAKQGVNPDVTVFQRDKHAEATGGGFTWRDTSQGHGFWDWVIDYKNFRVFFRRYPIRKPRYVFANANGNGAAEDMAIHYGVRNNLAMLATEGIYFVRRGGLTDWLMYVPPTHPEYKEIIETGIEYVPLETE